jgi:Zn ribbon nucleic-acid-binding protein
MGRDLDLFCPQCGDVKIKQIEEEFGIEVFECLVCGERFSDRVERVEE